MSSELNVDPNNNKQQRAQQLANQYAEKKVEKAFNDMDKYFVAGETEGIRKALGRHLALAYALGYCDGWDKTAAVKLYV